MCSDFKKRILFIGIPDMALICLEGLLRQGFNIVGVAGPKKNHDAYAMFKNFAAGFAMNFIEYNELDDADFIEKIQNLNADIAVVCSFNYKIPKVLLETVKGGFINVHPSLLPKYRGANPYSAPIINGEEITGVTLHFMDEKFDTGNIILQKITPVSDCETMGTLFNRTNSIALDMLIEILTEFEKTSQLKSVPQPKGDFIKAPALKDEELLIDFSKSAVAIERKIRALNPFIVARTNFRQNFVRVFAAEVIPENSEKGEFGEVVYTDNGSFYVKTGEGLIAFTALQFGSYFIGSSREFIRIVNPKTGERFG